MVPVALGWINTRDLTTSLESPYETEGSDVTTRGCADCSVIGLSMAGAGRESGPSPPRPVQACSAPSAVSLPRRQWLGGSSLSRPYRPEDAQVSLRFAFQAWAHAVRERRSGR